MNEDKYTIQTGFLNVGDGHKIYYQQWGNIDKTPTFFLHGGPGSGTSNKHKTNFDPKRHHIIFHDQRGCGQSTPFASTKNNTTSDLVSDIDKLRAQLGIARIQITGGSWGSFLALAYAAANPKNVIKMLISGVFTGTKAELDHIQQGGLKTHYPDSWKQYIEIVPQDRRGDTAAYYYEMMLSTSGEKQEDYIRRWILLEISAMSIDSDYISDKQKVAVIDDKSRSVAMLEAHYFVNNCFNNDNLLSQPQAIKALSTIPIIMVTGRYDHVCPPKPAYDLSEKLGDNCHLHMVPSSHGNEGSNREVVRAYTWSFLG